MSSFVIFSSPKGLDWRNQGQWLPLNSIPVYTEDEGQGVTIWADFDQTAFDAVLGEARLEMALWNREALRKEDVPLFVLAVCEFGQRALHRLAAFGRGGELVDALVEAGANINAKTAGGMTPLDAIFANADWPLGYQPSQDGAENGLAAEFRRLGAKTAVELAAQ